VKYKIAVHRTDEGISVSVPALPGCWSEGDTEEEALANIQDAIREYLAALEDRFQDAEVREVEVETEDQAPRLTPMDAGR
jgi:predicted RNase H-like HicB family nuclease